MSLRAANAALAALVAVLVGGWRGASTSDVTGAAPPASIPTFSTADIARTGFFYVGGHYVGRPGKEVMDGAMYVEEMVPRRSSARIRSSFFKERGKPARLGRDQCSTPV
jgi:hypothetical protein